MKHAYTAQERDEFLKESNAIEREYDDDAFEYALKAWEYLDSKKFLTLEVVLGAHHLLMQNLRPDIAGFWRNCAVRIGNDIKPRLPRIEIEAQIRAILDDINFEVKPENFKGTKAKRALRAKRAHIRFEKVHPFEDGNGRIGRLIYNWHRIRLELPIDIIHEGFEQVEYYKWFSKKP